MQVATGTLQVHAEAEGKYRHVLIPVKNAGSGQVNPTLTPCLRRLAIRPFHLAQPCNIMQSNLVNPEAAHLFVHLSPLKPNPLPSCMNIRASTKTWQCREVTVEPT
jgi:hypothetical protein